MRCSAVIAVVLACVTAACGPNTGSDQSGTGALVQEPPSPSQVAAAAMPPLEKSLVKMAGTESDATESAPNDIIANQVSAKIGADRCRVVRDLHAFSNWTGTVENISSDGRFSVSPSGDLATSFEGPTHPGTPLFKAITKLQDGEAVAVSGSFDDYDFRGADEGCRFEMEASVVWTAIAPLAGGG